MNWQFSATVRTGLIIMCIKEKYLGFDTMFSWALSYTCHQISFVNAYFDNTFNSLLNTTSIVMHLCLNLGCCNNITYIQDTTVPLESNVNENCEQQLMEEFLQTLHSPQVILLAY